MMTPSRSQWIIPIPIPAPMFYSYSLPSPIGYSHYLTLPVPYQYLIAPVAVFIDIVKQLTSKLATNGNLWVLKTIENQMQQTKGLNSDIFFQ